MAKLLKVNWLKMEYDLREALKDYQDNGRDPKKVLEYIDEIIAEATRRGNELRDNPNDRVKWD